MKCLKTGFGLVLVEEFRFSGHPAQLSSILGCECSGPIRLQTYSCKDRPDVTLVDSRLLTTMLPAAMEAQETLRPLVLAVRSLGAGDVQVDHSWTFSLIAHI